MYLFGYRGQNSIYRFKIFSSILLSKKDLIAFLPQLMMSHVNRNLGQNNMNLANLSTHNNESIYVHYKKVIITLIKTAIIFSNICFKEQSLLNI